LALRSGTEGYPLMYFQPKAISTSA